MGQLPGPGGRLRSPAGQPLKIEIGRDGRPVGVFILETPLPAAAGPKAPQGEGQRQQKGGQEGRKQAERELRALIREGRRRRGGGCGRGGVGGAAGLGRGRGRGGGLGLLRAALAGSAPGVDGGDLHRLPPVAVDVDLHPGVGGGVGHVHAAGGGHVGHKAGDIAGGDAHAPQQQHGGAGKVHAVAPMALGEEPGHKVLPLRRGGGVGVVFRDGGQVVRHHLGGFQLIGLLHSGGGDVLGLPQPVGQRLQRAVQRLAERRVFRVEGHLEIVLPHEVRVGRLRQRQLPPQARGGGRGGVGLDVDGVGPHPGRPGQIGVVDEFRPGQLAGLGQDMVGNVDIARIGPHIAHGDPGVGAPRVGVPNRQGGEIHGLELGEQGLSPSDAKVHVQRDGRSICDAAEAGLPVVGRLIQRLPALAVIYRVGEPPQVDAASEVGLHLQHGASGEAQRPRVGERDGAVGVGQPSPAAANAEGAAPLQQAVPQADGLIGEVL